MSEYRLVMKGVVKTFPGVKALDHAQLELRPGKVMALMGENGAGKSTLMKCMFGIYKMDEGEIEYEGQKVTIPTPLDALDRGIAMVHQELQPIPARTVAENIWLGRYPTKKYGIVTVVDHAKMYKDTDELLKKLKLDIDPHAKLGSLSIAQMQMVEIAKAVSANCKVLIIDGGFCRAYHKETGIAGYTLIYNSYGLSLTAHEPFESTEKAIREEKDIVSRQVAVRYNMKRQLVGDTDQGRQIRQRIRELKELIEAYRTAQLKELL